MVDRLEISDKKISLVREKMLSFVGLVITLGSFILGFSMLLVKGYIESYTLLLIFFTTGILLVLIGELFQGRKAAFSNPQSKRTEKDIARLSNEFSSLHEYIKESISNSEENISNVTNNSVSNINLTKEEKEQLFGKLSDDVRSIVAKDFIEQVSNQEKNKIQHDDVLSFASEFRDRMVRETERLSGRANTNLFIGSITSIIGIAILGYTLVGGAPEDIVLTKENLTVQIAQYSLEYMPKLTLVIFIEIFSYFFLRLYKSSLEDIKYYQNELTNIDSDISALRLSLLVNDSASIKKVLEKLLSTERNFVLKKGDTTVQLEVARTEAQKSSEALKMFEGLFKETKRIVLPGKGSNK